MAKYDENLKENPFFMYVKEYHPGILKRVAEEKWLLCVPRKGTVEHGVFSQLDVLKHSLVPDEQHENVYTTLTDQRVILHKDAFITDEEVHGKAEDKKKVGILFTEVLYEAIGKCKLMCLESPLLSEKPVDHLPSILSISDAVNFLCQGLQNFSVMHKLDSIAADVCKRCSDIQLLEPLSELASNAYQVGCSLVMGQSNFKDKIISDHYYKKILELSVITYLQHKIFPSIIDSLIVIAAEADATLNMQVCNAFNISLSDINILCNGETLYSAVKEMKAFFKFQTYIDKMECVKKVISRLNAEHNCISSDDLLPYLSYITVKVGMPNWNAHLMFLKHFHFGCEYQDPNEARFHVATLEAVLLFVSSGALFINFQNYSEADKEDSGQFFLLSEADELLSSCTNSLTKEYFSHVQLSNLSELSSIFQQSTLNDSISAGKPLCHPLCTCKACLSRKSEKSCVTARSTDDDGHTGLHIACFLGCPKVIRLLLTHGVDIDAVDKKGNTALHYAALKGHKNCVLLLLHGEANVNLSNLEGYTPLHLAALNGHTGCLKGLLFYSELHGSIDCIPVNKAGDTPLHLACKWGFIECVQVLIDQIKEGNVSLMVPNKAGHTPVDICSNVLLKRVVTEAHKENIANISTKLLSASSKRLSVDSGCVSQNSPGTSGTKQTAASRSNDYESPKGSVDIKSYPPAKQLSAYEKTQLSQCLQAIKCRDFEKVYRLLSFSSRRTIDNTKTSMLCHPLCQCDKCLVSAPLEDTNIEPCTFLNGVGTEGLGVIHTATSCGLADLVELLLNKNCNPNLLSGVANGCSTALHFACTAGSHNMVEILLDHGADIDAIDTSGNTALHITASTGNARLLQMLLSRGADVTVINYDGRAAEDVARDYGYLAAVEMLRHSLPESS